MGSFYSYNSGCYKNLETFHLLNNVLTEVICFYRFYLIQDNLTLTLWKVVFKSSEAPSQPHPQTAERLATLEGQYKTIVTSLAVCESRIEAQQLATQPVPPSRPTCQEPAGVTQADFDKLTAKFNDLRMATQKQSDRLDKLQY